MTLKNKFGEYMIVLPIITMGIDKKTFNKINFKDKKSIELGVIEELEHRIHIIKEGFYMSDIIIKPIKNKSTIYEK